MVEAKRILEPTESMSIGTHWVAIEGAVDQAKARVKLIEEHRDGFITDMKKFSSSLPPEFRVNPLIVVSTVPTLRCRRLAYPMATTTLG